MFNVLDGTIERTINASEALWRAGAHGAYDQIKASFLGYTDNPKWTKWELERIRKTKLNYKYVVLKYTNKMWDEIRRGDYNFGTRFL